MIIPKRIHHKALVLLLLLLVCGSCYMPKAIFTSLPTLPTREFKTPPQKIVVANAYDLKEASVRNNKEILFGELINLAMRQTSNELTRRGAIPSEFVMGVSVTKNDSSVSALMNKYNASDAIIIKSFDAFFDQTRVDVTESDQGKNRQAFYDIVVGIGYSFHNKAGHVFDTLISARKFHSSRSVVSGLFAAGPNIVSNSVDAAEGINANVDMYLKSFFSSTEPRTRAVYISSAFKEVGAAMRESDHERAFELSEKLMTSDKKMVAALAGYNCAVLLEYLGRYDQVKYYLEKSLNTYSTPQAEEMMMDYRPYRALR